MPAVAQQSDGPAAAANAAAPTAPSSPHDTKPAAVRCAFLPPLNVEVAAPATPGPTLRSAVALDLESSSKDSIEDDMPLADMQRVRKVDDQPRPHVSVWQQSTQCAFFWVCKL